MPSSLLLLLLTCCFLLCGLYLYYYFVWYLSFGEHIKWTGSLYMAFVLCCWVPKAPQKLNKSHWCVPFTATFSKRRKIGALWSERCDAPVQAIQKINVIYLRGTLFFSTLDKVKGAQNVLHAGPSTILSEIYIRKLPRRVCSPQLCAMPVLHARAPEQAREDISPCKN